MICLQSEWGGWKDGIIGGLGWSPVWGLEEGLGYVFLSPRMCVCTFMCVFSRSWWIQGLWYCSHSCSRDPSGLYWTARSVWQAGSVYLFPSASLRSWILNILDDTVVLLWHLFLSCPYLYHSASFCIFKKTFIWSLIFFFPFTVCFISLPLFSFYSIWTLTIALWTLYWMHLFPNPYPVELVSQKDRSTHTHLLPPYLNISSSLPCTLKHTHTPPSISAPGCPCGLFAIGPLTPVQSSKLQPFS